jgi:3-deoxy-manno-octulosonate cytidylyltransferase (CMP-KDO synthetase)
MTSERHLTGTDRLAEASLTVEADIFVNVQGDEPFLDPAGIDAAVRILVEDPSLPISTLSLPLRDAEEMLRPSVVKVVTDIQGNALYFSRSPIPYLRFADAGEHLARKHVGLYAYRREALLRLASLPPAPLEVAEGLEQLRALHHGLRIRVVPQERDLGPAVDTPEDLERVRALLDPKVKT